MPGFTELAVMVFALAISFSVFLVHKGVKEKEAGLTVLAVILFLASVILTFMIIYRVSFAGSLTEDEPASIPEMVEEVTN
ncbi:hypothetical protein J7K50_00820 [bacterium]|nr:hypothetical protein [bacterium]